MFNKDFLRNHDLGLLVLRLSIGGLLLFHGIHKAIFGIDAIGVMLEQLGLPAFIAYGAMLCETVAPVMIVVGLWLCASRGVENTPLPKALFSTNRVQPA